MPFIINDVPIDCINQAAISYHIPAILLVSVLKTENGRNGMIKQNSNGTYDLGPMQINSRWLAQLSPYGITASALQNKPCINVSVGAWILSHNIASSDQLWQGVGNYHSHTWQLNQTYQQKVKSMYDYINQHIN